MGNIKTTKMKQILTLSLTMLLAFAAAAQDTIITRTGKVQLATIKMVDRTSVQYQDYPQSDGYTYLMDIDKIKELRYHDGRYINYMPVQKAEPTSSTITPFSVNPPYKNPAAAFAFSTVPGLGQFYNDEVGKGLWFMGVGAVSAIAFNISYANVVDAESKRNSTSESNSATIMVLSGLTLIVDYVWATIDAVKTANKKNKANGYVVSLSPSMQYNAMAMNNGGLGFTPSLSMSISF